MDTVLTVFSGIAVAASLVWYIPREIRREAEAKKRKIEEVFAGRESLTPEVFYEHYFLGHGIALEVVVGIRKILEEHLGADMSSLRVEDDFSKNLSFFWDFDSMADVEVVVAIEEYFQIKISDTEADESHTVYDLVQLVSGKVSKTGVP